jgi:phage-related protein
MRRTVGIWGGEGKRFFFEKKNQKTFEPCDACCGCCVGSRAREMAQKFFGSFFQKRTSSFPPHGPREMAHV